MKYFTLSTWADSVKTDPIASSSSSKVVQIVPSNRPHGSLYTWQLPIKAANFDAYPLRFNALAKYLSRLSIASSWLSAPKTLDRLMSMFLLHSSAVTCKSSYMSSLRYVNNICCWYLLVSSNISPSELSIDLSFCSKDRQCGCHSLESGVMNSLSQIYSSSTIGNREWKYEKVTDSCIGISDPSSWTICSDIQ